VTELLRPWKLATLAIGIALLVVGSFIYDAPDWDIPISIIMAVVAYGTAPWCMRVLVERRWRAAPLALLLTWFGVDGCYALYWAAVDPRALELMRDANAPASLSLFMAVGLLWSPRASLSSMYRIAAMRLRAVVRRQ
jgi:hypothetical protein